MIQLVLNFVSNHWLMTIFSILVFNIFYQVILKPYILILSQKIKYGSKITTFFFPIAGIFVKNLRSMNKENHLSHKMAIDHIKKNPESKMLVTNNKSELVYYLHDADLIQDFLVTKKALYEKNTEQFLFLKDIVVQGISGQVGQQWKYLRSITAPSFHFQQLIQKIGYIKKYSKKMLELIEEKRSKDEEVDTLHTIQQINGVVLFATLMGETYTKSYEEMESITREQDYLIDTGVGFIGSPSLLNFIRNMLFSSEKTAKDIPSWLFTQQESDYFKRADKYNSIVDSFVERRIQDTKAGKGAEFNDFLQTHVDQYLADKKEESESGVPKKHKVTPEIIRHQFTNVLTGGVGAPSSSLTMCLQMLIEHPEWQIKIREEMKENFDFEANNDETFQILQQKMPNLDIFIKETLRMFSPSSGFFTQRRALSDHKLGEFDVKKGQLISVNILGNSNNPKNFKNPEIFDPCRWEGDHKIHSYAYLPFLGGARNCIGQHLGKLEVKIELLHLLREYRLESTGVPFQTTQYLNLTIENRKYIKYVPLSE